MRPNAHGLHRSRRRLRLILAVALLLPASVVSAQTAPGAAPPSPPAQQAEAPRDVLGRNTPRGTVLGFLGAARKGENDFARQYLNTRLTGRRAEDLAHQLFVVLDARLQARLPQLSDAPEGSSPATPGLEAVGTIVTAEGNLEIMLERVPRDDGHIWLFSSKTLDAIPTVHEAIMLERNATFLPRILTTTRIGGIRLVEWLAIVVGLAILYIATVLLSRVLTPLLSRISRRAFEGSELAKGGVIPVPARLLILSILSRRLLESLPFSLLMRQFWASIASLVAIVSIAWLLILVTGEVERYVRRRIPAANVAAAISLLRLVRRCVDLLVVFAAIIAMLRYFGVDPTPALAGLGVGGIAVALAAQKTLENVIAGASLIFDQAVKVGDFLQMGTISGTVEHIGLRSTRLRTLDRTIVSIPNSQIATTSVETFSARDKFWFHPVVGLRYETTSDQLRTVVANITRLLAEHPSVARESVRVRFIRLGAFSLDVDVSAYLNARDWNHFLEIQEQLLLSMTDIVERAGTAIAFPSQTMYVTNTPGVRTDADSVSAR